MKIIEPLRLDGEGVVSSNAPDDVAIPWEPVGRYLGHDLEDVQVSAAGDKAYILGTDVATRGVKLKVQQLPTGDTSDLVIPSLSFLPEAIAVSPDGQYLAVGCSNPANPANREVHIYSLATLNRVYRRQDVDILAHYSGFTHRIAWSGDSTKLGFWAHTVKSPSDGDRKPRIVVVAVSGWTEVVSSGTATDYWSLDPLPYDWDSRVGALTFDDSGSAVFGTTSTVQRYRNAEHYLLRVDAASGAVTHYKRDGGSFGAFLIYNGARSELLCVTGNYTRQFDGATLSPKPDGPVLSGATRYSTSPAIPLKGTGKIYFRDSGEDIGYRVYSAADYSRLPALDPDVSISPLIGESDDYYISSSYGPGADGWGNFGFELVDKATMEPVVAINPLIPAGAVYQYRGRIYEALSQNNDRPDQGVVAEPPTWLDLGAINRLRMIDETIGTYTEAPDYLEILVAPSELVDGIGLFNLTAASYQIELLDDAGAPVFSTGEISLIDVSGVHGWYSYFNDEPAWQTDAVHTALPPYRGATIRITVQGLGGTARVGELVAGRVRDLGDLEFGADTGILDFSRKDRDEFGVVRLIEGQYSNRVRYPVSIRSARILGVRQILTRLRGRKFVFIGDESAPETFLYGFYRSFSLVRKGPIYSECSIQAESLAQ